MAAPALLALVILAAPFWFEDSDRAKPPAPAASPASPSCAAGEALWGTQCLARYGSIYGPPDCADGVVLFTEEMSAPACVPCAEASQLDGPSERFCLAHMLQKHDAALNELYQSLLSEFPAHEREVRAGERAWIRRRDATCHNEVAAEGSIAAPLVLQRCLDEATVKRIAELGLVRDGWKKKPKKS